MKWFNNPKRYVFIFRKKNEDVFVHYRSIEDEEFKSLAEGDKVQFEVFVLK